MDLALSTVLIILGVLPGIVFWNSYLSGRFSKQVFGGSTVSELAWYVVLAVPINAAALALVSDDPRMIKLKTVLAIVFGNAGDDLDSITASLQAGWRFNLVGYLAVVLICYVAGVFCRRLIWALRFDVYIPALRMRHYWYYLLQGRFPRTPRQVLPYADVLVEHPDGSRLYRGLVASFEPDSDGEIRHLVLADAQRGKGRGADFKWFDIPGRRFILWGPTIHSINMRYVYVSPPKGRGDRAWYELKGFILSFLFEDP